LSRRIGPQVWCALLVFLHAATWALVTPSFHVPDEPQHFAYAQHVAETGELTRPIEGSVFSEEEGRAFEAARFNEVAGNPSGRPPWGARDDAALERLLNSGLGRDSDGAGTSTTNNPPLYYLVQAVPYHVAGGDFFQRLLAMRLTSALMAGLAALFVFGFVRELLPGSPLAWTAGALAAGLAPLVGFIAGGVNNDAGLLLGAAATLWALARAFRRGLDLRSGLLVGACFGLTLVTKVNIVGFAPGLLLAGGVMLARQWRDGRRAALAGLAAAAGAVALPCLLYLLAINTIWDRPLWSGGIAFGTVGGEGGAGKPGVASLAGLLSYAWQFYLPPLPSMSYRGPAEYGLWDVWFTGWIGRFGWLDYDFPEWVFTVAGILWVGLLALVARGLFAGRAALSRRRGEAAAYVTIAAGLVLVSHVQGYRYAVDTELVFEQARYLLPLLALYAGGVGIAVAGAGRRWGPTVAATIVALTLVQTIGALVITLGRFYV
jgi:4-amino-4-deoxy-L-arabinose transferase-like glycosyltransferase